MKHQKAGDSTLVFQAHGGRLKPRMAHSKASRAALFQKALTLRRLSLTAKQLCDLELIVSGAFSPLAGFMTEEAYESVIASMRLPSGILWPIPITLDVPDDADFHSGETIVLSDEYNKPVALMHISSVWKPDKKKEARMVYGTTDDDHPGVNYLLRKTGNIYLGGDVEGIAQIDRYDFTAYRHTPLELRQWFLKKKWNTIIGFQTRNPLHRAHFSMMRHAAEMYHGNVLVHPAVGMTKDGDFDYITRVRCYITLVENHMSGFAKLSLLPLAMRMAGPKEALWHAIIRKNYGCTHFVVGRDHAGPGKNAKGVPFYGPYDAQTLLRVYQQEVGIVMIPFSEMVYVPSKRTFLPKDQVSKGTRIRRVSGTSVRALIREGKRVPGWISFPDIVAELRKGIAKDKKDGLTIFFTGLPCAGKSTIARILVSKLLEVQDKKVTLLDGDVIRRNLSKGLGFTKDDRNTNIKRIGFVASEITKHGGIAVCAAVAPYEEARAANRALISSYGHYVEVYVATPLRECKRRDVKGLYRQGALGKIQGVTGVDDPYEAPQNAEIVLNTLRDTPVALAESIIRFLVRNRLIYPHHAV